MITEKDVFAAMLNNVELKLRVGKPITNFGKAFKEKHNYFGKLTKEAMGKELWNVYCSELSADRNRRPEHLKAKEERRKKRKAAALERQAKKRTEGIAYAKYCDDFKSIENYEAAKADGFKCWQLHHRLETHFSDGTLRPLNARLTYRELKALGIYYHRPASELIFMPMVEHRRLHLCGIPNCINKSVNTR